MAPPAKGQPKPVRSAPSNPKKHHAPSASASAHYVPATNTRQHVVPAIPLPLMHRQANSISKAGAKPAPAHAHVSVASSLSHAPVASLEAPSVDHDSARPSRIPEGDIQQQRSDTVGHATLLPLRNEKGTEASELQVNGVSNGNIESPLRVEATQCELWQNSISSKISDELFPRLHLAGPDGSAYPSETQSAASPNRAEFVNFPSQTHLLQQHQQHMGEQRHPPGLHAPHPHHMHPNHQHRHQMSNGGGIMFGVLDSHTPSPAPLPGGFLPPPHPPMNGDNRGHPGPSGHHHNHSNGNGFPGPVNTHFRGDMAPITTMDAYGTVPAPVQASGQPHYEALPPGASRYGPPTPHSFHGSHASGDHNGIDNPALPYHPNGSYAPPRHEHPVAHPHHPGPFPPFIPPQPVSQQFNMADEGFMESVDYIRSSFDNGELSDCILELKSTKGRHHPIKISGHKLILARSPALKRAILATRSADRSSSTISLETDDPHLRSDAWWVAVQRLYLHPLLPPPPMVGNVPNGIDFAGDKADRFDFCLGYVAAGYVLMMRDIVVRGLYIAAHSLTWETVEAGLGFVLDGSIQRYQNHGTGAEQETSPSVFLEFRYGADTKILLTAILDFLVNEFPPNFELDVSVLDNPKIARIPQSAGSPATPTLASDQVVPAIARGTTTRQASKQSRVTSIKFGDLPIAYPDDGSLAQRQPAKCSTILSCILLNLPYDQLCQVMTSGSQGVPGWNTAQERYHAVADIVSERETRRLRGVEAVRSGSVPQARDIQLHLSAAQPYPVADPWDVLNWEEQVLHGETPRIVRRWVPQFNVVPQPTEQPMVQAYGIPDSMV